MDVNLAFKPAGDDVRLLIIHSTKDDLGKKTATALCGALSPNVQIVGIEQVADFCSVKQIIATAQPFNILLIVAHGDHADHKFWLHGDNDLHGNELGVSAGELKALFECEVDDKLLIFGVCYAGTDDLATLMVDQGGALACVAPKPNATINDSQVINGYGHLLNDIQSKKAIDVGPYELQQLFHGPTLQQLLPSMSVSPQV